MKNLPNIGIVFGLLLILLGVVGYLAGGGASVTALIPAFFGLPLALVSALGRKESMRKHAMHVASIFGLLGFLAPLGRIIPAASKGEFALDLAGTSMILMSLLSGIFFILCFRFFLDARKARKAAGPESENG